MTRRSLLFVVAMFVTACGHDPARHQRIVAEQAARLRHPDVPLRTFGTFELVPLQMSAEVAAEAGKVQVASDLGQKLEIRLRPMVQEWSATSTPDVKGHVLVIQPVVASLRVVGGASRVWLGAMAGDSYIDLDLVLTDKQTGRPVAQERIHTSSGGMAGAWSGGSADRNLTDYAADIAQAYLVNNR
jgi:hypothetical protein